ncbi:Predicted flavoprotein CzcO associated with the cation diffusion facilitator CzcD [Thermomonospora echinospora]|uniref:Predicted flavoprotein CzcO associated with the cation diffusion facilitator CzcD n=1 Tax=Thermomonospora echinospora TaxID=1992 RepID=A0A1H6CSU1_9ACTN|nr:ArsO family NAD(P)H-dependent flavin-containing monooxygenase [Thermomonospora echinospora]SEG75847.1 Predicted flavoprotein CzcO associated with the cation diffusion facilitator CzcD [Thermomonospora echinospora]
MSKSGQLATADVVVIGGGQAGLAAGYYLRRAGLDFVILDAQDGPGGAWRHVWPSLRLFSPAQHSSLPGRPMPATREPYPSAAHVVDYLADYEKRYALPVHRPVRVHHVHRDGPGLRVDTDRGTWHAAHVISATGTWWQPYLPHYPGRALYQGQQLHTVHYRGPAPFQGQRVVIVGGGNSAAQILADLTDPALGRGGSAAEAVWVTRRPPRLLPDHIDGRALFTLAARRRADLHAGRADTGGVGGLGDIVAVPPVRAARDRGALQARPMFTRLTETGIGWDDGPRIDCEAIIWCTGFRPALRHLSPLRLRTDDGAIPLTGTRAHGEPRLHLIGYGDWTGLASATLIGAGMNARDAVRALTSHPRQPR